MQVKLFKVPFFYQDKAKVERKGYNYFLLLESGSYIRIEPNTYKSANGKYYSSESQLQIVATEVDDIRNAKF